MRAAIIAIALLTPACGAPRLATQRAIAAGIGAGAAAGGAALAACARDTSDTCRDVAVYSLAGAFLVGAATSAATFLLETQDDKVAPSAR